MKPNHKKDNIIQNQASGSTGEGKKVYRLPKFQGELFGIKMYSMDDLGNKVIMFNNKETVAFETHDFQY